MLNIFSKLKAMVFIKTIRLMNTITGLYYRAHSLLVLSNISELELFLVNKYPQRFLDDTEDKFLVK